MTTCAPALLTTFRRPVTTKSYAKAEASSSRQQWKKTDKYHFQAVSPKDTYTIQVYNNFKQQHTARVTNKDKQVYVCLATTQLVYLSNFLVIVTSILNFLVTFIGKEIHVIHGISGNECERKGSQFAKISGEKKMLQLKDFELLALASCYASTKQCM